MDDMDMLLPVLPVRGNDPKAGNSRPPGNADGGPTETGGGRGAGGIPYGAWPPGPGFCGGEPGGGIARLIAALDDIDELL
jgi:hypothetical protein